MFCPPKKRSNLDCAVVCWTWVRLGSPRHGNRPYVTWSAGICDDRWNISSNLTRVKIWHIARAHTHTYVGSWCQTLVGGHIDSFWVLFCMWRIPLKHLHHQAWSNEETGHVLMPDALALRPWSIEHVESDRLTAFVIKFRRCERA